MKPTQVQVQETTTVNQKVALIVGMISAFLVGMAIMVTVAPTTKTEVSTVTPGATTAKTASAQVVAFKSQSELEQYVTAHEKDARPEVKFSPNQILVKFKEGVDVPAASAEITRHTVEEYYNTKTGDVVSDMINRTSTDSDFQTNPTQYTKRTVNVTAKNIESVAINIAEKSLQDKLTARKISSADIDKAVQSSGISRWKLIEFTQPKINISAALSLFKNDQRVESAEPNLLVNTSLVPNDPYYASSNSWNQGYDDLWGLKAINMAQAWDLSQGSSSVIVAVVDTGVAYAHTDIDANIWQNSDEVAGNSIDDDNNGFVDDVRGWDFVNNDNNPLDDCGHGTHVAGTIAAEINNNTGIVGVCPNCKVMAVKSFDWLGSASMFNADMGVLYAAQNGADIINMSWGASGYSEFESNIMSLVNSLGVVLVAAAGNDNDNSGSYTPARLDDVITVSSINRQNTRSSFSNWGKIDVAAPGGDNGSMQTTPTGQHYYVNILSLLAPGTDMYHGAPNYTLGEFIVGGNYYRARGTSMAAPHVAGLAGLILSYHPAFTAGQIRSAIEQTATDLGATGWDQDTGYGRINPYLALQQTNPLSVTITSPATSPVFITKGQTITITGSASGQNFSQYTVSYAQGTYAQGATWTTFKTSSTPVTSGTLANWNTTGLFGNYLLKLEVTSTTGYHQRIIRNALAGIESGWPVNLTAERGSVHATAANLDPASATEELVGTLSQGAFALHADGTSLNNWPVSVPMSPTVTVEDTIYEATAVGDVDNDGDQEVFLTDRYSQVYAYHHNGTTPVSGWPKTIGTYTSANPVLADINNDGYLEVLVNSVNSSDSVSFKVYTWNGTLLWSKTGLGTNTSYYQSPPPAVGNLDTDTQPEIVLPVGNQLYIWNHDGTALNAQWPKTLTNDRLDVTLADINADDITEILIGGSTTIYVYRPDGSLAPGSWPLTLMPGDPLWDPNNIYPYFQQFAVGDVNPTNPGLELVIMMQGPLDLVTVFSATGTVLNGYVMSGFMHSTPALADVNGDGIAEFASIEETEDEFWLWVLNNDFIQLTSFPIFLQEKQYSSEDGYSMPTMRDIDADNKAELFAISGGRAFLFELPGAGKAEWPMYQRDARHSGWYPPPICTGGIPSGACNASHQYCHQGQFINDCNKCGYTCTSPLKCQTSTGHCVQCLSNSDCTGGQQCDTTTGQCFTPPVIKCYTDDDCADGISCNKDHCNFGGTMGAYCTHSADTCCANGTGFNSCTADSDLYCNANGVLENRCVMCGCANPTYFKCDYNKHDGTGGTCVCRPDPAINCCIHPCPCRPASCPPLEQAD